MKHIKEVYETYKHFDKILSDEKFLTMRHEDENFPIQYKILHDLWRAIKNEVEEVNNAN
jgi:hypothetical protein